MNRDKTQSKAELLEAVTAATDELHRTGPALDDLVRAVALSTSAVKALTEVFTTSPTVDRMNIIIAVLEDHRRIVLDHETAEQFHRIAQNNYDAARIAYTRITGDTF